MNGNKIFYVLACALLMAGAFVVISPSLVEPDLIRPQRIDSIYIQFQRTLVLKEHPVDFPSIDSTLFFNPADLGMDYEEFNVRTADKTLLRGWFIAAKDTSSGPNTILVLHDWNESKIQKLNFAMQMRDRGFNVCLMDLRAHGNSEGTEFSPGILAASDVKCMLDSLLSKPLVNHVAIFGSGVSAAIAMQSAVYDGRADVLIVQCPVKKFSRFVHHYARKKWGWSRFIFYPLLERRMEHAMQMQLEELDLVAIGSAIKTPVQFIAASEDEFYSPIEAYAIFDSSAAVKKDLILVNQSTSSTLEVVGGEKYYNAIAEFINTAVPKKPVKVRYKKLT